jgi:hypothetical protein
VKALGVVGFSVDKAGLAARRKGTG